MSDSSSSRGQAGSNARSALGKILGFLILQVAFSAATSLMASAAMFWVVLVGTILIGGAWWLTSPGGALARSAEGVSPAQRAMAGLFLIAYVGLSIFAQLLASELAMAVTIWALATAAGILCWPILRPTVTLLEAAAGLAGILAGSTLILIGSLLLLNAHPKLDIILSLVLLVGFITLVSGAAIMLQEPVLIGWASVLIGVLLAAAHYSLGQSVLERGYSGQAGQIAMLAVSIGGIVNALWLLFSGIHILARRARYVQSKALKDDADGLLIITNVLLSFALATGFNMVSAVLLGVSRWATQSDDAEGGWLVTLFNACADMILIAFVLQVLVALWRWQPTRFRLMKAWTWMLARRS